MIPPDAPSAPPPRGRRQRPGKAGSAAAAWLLWSALALRALGSAAQAAAFEVGGELRAVVEARGANDAGPLAAAVQLAPGIAPPARNATRVEAELRGVWRPIWLQPAVSALHANLLLAAQRPEGGPTDSHARVNELHADSDLGAWQLSAGKKVVGWDVGYAFRPNDMVQQEERRTLLAVTPEGRPLLQLEHFGAQSASSLVWVNPQHAGDDASEERGARESALAARWYRRAGAADWHLFGRWGQHTRASAGVALAWVAGDELELHGSARALQRHDGWRIDPRATTMPVTANPWAQTTLAGTSQALLGASWTGAAQQSVLLEWWHDGTAPSDATWDAWSARNGALVSFAAQPGLPGAGLAAAAGNLAWQATPFNGASLRRDNVFVRLAWQPDHWLLWLDALVTPSDRGHLVTLGVQWQGDRVRLNLAARAYGGPARSLLAQLPQRRMGLVAATWAF